MKKIRLGRRLVGDGESVYIIAEGGVTHFGDLNLAKKQVDAAIDAQCDAIKFQKRNIALIPDSYWRKRLEYKELSEGEMIELRNYCQSRNIEFFVTPHDIESLDFVDKILDIPFIKIGSGESLNYEFLKDVGSRQKPVIISFGLHIFCDEIAKTVESLEKYGTREIVLLHCNTVYPSPPEIINLGGIDKLRKLFDYPVGYSDHSVGWHVPLAAVARGVKVIEKHLSFDKADERSLDCLGSCLPEELKLMVSQIRDLEKAVYGVDECSRLSSLKEARKWVKKMTG